MDSFMESFFLAVANNMPRSRIADKVRWKVLKLAGIKFKGRAKIWGPITIRPVGGAENIEIGAGVFINTEVRFGVPSEKVIIGNGAQIGPRVSFETVSNSLLYEASIGRENIVKPITVGEGVWIAAGAIISPGVTIGDGAVVAAGSVVVCDVEPFTLVGGVPAKFIKKIK